MIQAERLLLEAALDDPANQRFVLLSDRSFVQKFTFFHYCWGFRALASFLIGFVTAKFGLFQLKNINCLACLSLNFCYLL